MPIPWLSAHMQALPTLQAEYELLHVEATALPVMKKSAHSRAVNSLNRRLVHPRRRKRGEDAVPVGMLRLKTGDDVRRWFGAVEDATRSRRAKASDLTWMGVGELAR